MRQIYIVDAKQVVVSDAHSEGMLSTVNGYPKTFDSRSYPAADGNPNGDHDRAYEVAEAEYHGQIAEFLRSTNRAMWAVTLERADGKQLMQATKGAFPDMMPEP